MAFRRVVTGVNKNGKSCIKWNNRGKEPCVMAFILIATEGGASTGW